MPRLRKMSYESRRKAGKLRMRREREVARQRLSDEHERQRLDNEYYKQKIEELQNLKGNAHLYLASFTPEWTEYNEDSQPAQSVKTKDICHKQATFNQDLHKLPSEVESTPFSTNQYPSHSGIMRENLKGKGMIKPIKEECDSPVSEGKLDVIVDIKVEQEADALDDMKLEDAMDGTQGVSGELALREGVQGEATRRKKDQEMCLSEPLGTPSCAEDNEENFVVDCDPMIIANTGLSSDLNRPSLSSDDNSSYSSSFFSDVMENNELFYKQMAGLSSTLNDAELAKALQEHYDKLEAITEDMSEKRQKAAAIQRRRRKRMLDRMTEHQLTVYRASQTEACRQRRIRRLERMSEEEKQRDRMLKNALCLARRHRREASMSNEERQARRAAAAAAQREKRRRKRENMSEEQLKNHKAEVAAIWRMRRHIRYMKMSEEERQAERAKAAEAKRISRQRQKDKEGEVEETIQYKRRPRRKKARSQLPVSESESDVLESSNFGMDGTAESLISQILKQTQHLAALGNQPVDLVPQHPLVELVEEHPHPERNQQANKPTPKQVPEEQADPGHTPQVKQEREDDDELNTSQECPRAKVQDKDQTNKVKQFHPDEGQAKNQTGTLQEFHQSNIQEHSFSGTPQQFYSNKIQVSDDQTEAPQQQHNKIQEGEQMRTSQQFPHDNNQYSYQTGTIHQFHHSSTQDVVQTGTQQHFRHNEIQNNQTGTIQQFHHSENYMNTLY